MSRTSRQLALLLLCAAILPALACAKAPNSYPADGLHAVEAAPPEPGDPLEPVNRAFLWFNRGLDRVISDPLSKVYGFVVPDPAKRAVRRAFSNLNAPVILVNDLLQLEFKQAGITMSRFAINTTVGLAGLLDPAEAIGLEAHHSDFGQTLARAGVSAGPFLVIPLVGPTTARDAVGSIVDFAFRPQSYLLPGGGLVALQTSDGLTQREELSDELDALESTALDYYSALRGAYLLQRESQIRGGEIPLAADYDPLFDDDSF